MRALIVEDERYSFEYLRNLIQDAYPQMEIEGPVTNLIDLERVMYNQHNYDVVYCDIQLEDGVCFSVLDHMDVTIPVIFTTAYSEYALNAFKANGIAYLLKPVIGEDLRKATEKALSMLRQPLDISAVVASLGLKRQVPFLHYLKAETYNGSLIIDVSDVVCFMAGTKNSYAIRADGVRLRVNYALEKLMQRLDPLMFYRANRQFIINRQSISLIEAYGNRQLLVKFKNPEDLQVVISKENVSLFNKWIEQ